MKDILARDLYCNWHPCSQMKEYQEFPALVIKSAKGAYLELADGRRIIDALSSWWCKSLGHGHPRLKAALREQLDAFEQVMFAHTTYENAVLLSEMLGQLTPQLNKVFYASDGASAVEIALKMSIHARQIQGQSLRTQFMSLEHAYHGETMLTMSVSDLGIYREPYAALLQANPVLTGIPYVSGRADPLWSDCGSYWPAIEMQLEAAKEKLSAVIVEPIVQGAAGMRIYSQDFLRRLRHWTRSNGIHLIADEIMTGLGRTGLPLASDHAGIEPDFLCLGKGLTGGFLPLSAVLTSDSIYQLFYADYDSGKSFLHSHTHSGNALAVSVARACLMVLQEESIYQKAQALETTMLKSMQVIRDETDLLTDVRAIGGIVAAELKNPQKIKRIGLHFFKEASKRGALVRPIGQTLYWLPPLNVEPEVLEDLKEITQQTVLALA